jgi:uncharacterized protein YeaO (DUF488 family)
VTVSDDAYGRLLALRTGLRHFERWSEQQARSAGLTPAQHQLLLAIRGHGNPGGPTIGEVADYLLLRHHSAVGLIDRADAAGLVRRTRDEDDHRVVRLQLTNDGADRLETLSTLHLEELARLAPRLPDAWEGLSVQTTHGLRRSPISLDDQGGGHLDVRIARVYDDLAETSARRILVDRLWPRGVTKSDAPFDQWLKDVAPSSQLRKWYAHVPERFEEFARRYRQELAISPALDALGELRGTARESGVILVTATRDIERSGAAVLRQVANEH